MEGRALKFRTGYVLVSACSGGRSVCALYNMGWHAEQAGRIAEALDCYRQAQQSGDEAAFLGTGAFL